MDLILSISEILKKDPRVIFAYLYGSVIEEQNFQDVDVGVYILEKYNPHVVSGDLKESLSVHTGFSPDFFDVRVINHADNLFYLRSVLNGTLIVDNDTEIRGNFIESFSMHFREAEGILYEAYG
jgi:predicted nucleotidyltransferase